MLPSMYAKLPAYSYHTPPTIQYSFQPQIQQITLEPPEPPKPDLPGAPPGDAPAVDHAKPTPVPATVEDATDVDTGFCQLFPY